MTHTAHDRFEGGQWTRAAMAILIFALTVFVEWARRH
jgi:hypothetical protein